MINAYDLIRYQLNRLASLYVRNKKNEFCAEAAAELRGWSDKIERTEVDLGWSFYNALRMNVIYLNSKATNEEALSCAGQIDRESDLLIGIIETTVAALNL